MVALYVFHVSGGDGVGSKISRGEADLPDMAAAQQHALVLCTEFLRSLGPERWTGAKWTMAIQDAYGVPLGTVVFSGLFE